MAECATGLLDQRQQDVHGAAAHAHRPVAVEQHPFRPEQSEGTEPQRNAIRITLACVPILLLHLVSSLCVPASHGGRTGGSTVPVPSRMAHGWKHRVGSPM